MSGEGATSGLIGKLPPLPLSVLHNSPGIRSAIHATPSSLSLFLFRLFLLTLVAQPTDFRLTATREKGINNLNKTHREAGI